MKKWLLLGILPFSLHATEYAPWFGNLFEPELRSAYAYQHYSKINSGENSFSHPGNNHFVDLSLAVSAWFDWNAEIEMGWAATSDHSFNLEEVKATGRYLFFDDVAGDPLSLALGLSINWANAIFLKDFAIEHHGNTNAEIHLAAGKEIPECYTDTWAYRYWGLIALGQANRGSPWLKGHLEWNINFCDYHEFGIFSRMLFGTGNKDIEPYENFNGYANIAHRSIDIGALYRHPLSYLGNLTIDYRYRAYAHNFPENAHQITLTLLLTFGI